MSKTPEAAAETHWRVWRDGLGWGCQGCDWTGATLDDYWTAHERRDGDIPF